MESEENKRRQRDNKSKVTRRPVHYTRGSLLSLVGKPIYQSAQSLAFLDYTCTYTQRHRLRDRDREGKRTEETAAYIILKCSVMR